MDLEPVVRRLTLPSDTDAPAAARRWVGSLDAIIDADRLADAVLVVSELVSNSVQHATGGGDGRIELTARSRVDEVEIGVRDGAGFVLPSDVGMPPPGESRGRGLPIVCGLADRVTLNGRLGEVSFVLRRR